MSNAAISTPPEFKAQSKLLLIEDIDESPSNPRKDYGDLSDLVESIRQQGVLQPVLARPKGDRFELVYGHRRYRAALKAGLEVLPANVREMTDQEVLEVQLVENAQRADIHPLEEADGYKRLHTEHGLSVEKIAERVGKSKAAVYAAMKLAELVEPALREAFLKNKLPSSTALLVARLSPEQQAEVAEMVLYHGYAEDDAGDDDYAPMSVRQVKSHIAREFFLGEDDEGELVELVEAKRDAEERAKKAAEAAKRADEKLRKAQTEKKKAASGGAKEKPNERTEDDVLKEEKSKLAAAMRDATFAKVEAKPDHDAKLIRVFLAYHLTEWMLKHRSEEYGIKLPPDVSKMDKGEFLTWKLEAFSKLKAEKLRELMLEAAFAEDYDAGEDGIRYRPDSALDVIRPAAKLFGVDLDELDKKFKAAVADGVAKLKPDVQTSAKPEVKKPEAKKAEPKKPAKNAKNPFKAATASARKTLNRVKNAGKKPKK